VAPGDIVPITLTVSNAAAGFGGLNVSATGGTLAAGGNTRLTRSEITHSSPTAMVAGSVTFDFFWTAPAGNGQHTLRAAGNAVDGNGVASGDAWNLAADLVITVSGCADQDQDGVTDCDGDCDDADPAINPTRPERCNGVDDDCDGRTDDPSALDATAWYEDADLDGWGDAALPQTACAAPFGTVDRAGDCDDGDGGVNPDAVEVCDPRDVDEDCANGAEDAAATGQVAFYADADGDGFGAALASVACDAPPGTSPLDGDCDDADPLRNPNAPESDCADPTDWNCDGATGFTDSDGDGFAACSECDDGDPAHFPGAAETCDGADDDCDGAVDEAGAAGATPWYPDADGDGRGAGAPVLACAAPPNHAAVDGDCDDARADVRPGAAEVWYDDVDQDCDGNDDDQDGDGVDAPADCLDTDPAVLPGAADAPYDGVDADCDGADDFDADGDGSPSAAHGGDDCDDADPAVRPTADDPPCDGVDVDCDPGPDVDPACAATDDTGGPRVGDDPEPPADAKEGCGCASSGTGAGGWLLACGLALRRRRRAPITG
jgi:hypothetical protein